MACEKQNIALMHLDASEFSLRHLRMPRNLRWNPFVTYPPVYVWYLREWCGAGGIDFTARYHQASTSTGQWIWHRPLPILMRAMFWFNWFVLSYHLPAVDSLAQKINGRDVNVQQQETSWQQGRGQMTKMESWLALQQQHNSPVNRPQAPTRVNLFG